MTPKFIKKILRSNAFSSCLAWLAAKLIRFVQITCRVEMRGAVDEMKKCIANNQPMIAVFWHSRSMMMTKFWRVLGDGTFNPAAGLTSVHRDGRLMGKVLGNLGLQIVEGSSTKGGAQAFKEILKKLKNGITLAITPDGPKGPRQRLSPGFMHIAKASGVPIFLVGISGSRAIFFNSWDKWMLIKPFSKCVFEVFGPYYVDREESPENMQILQEKLENLLNQSTIKLDESFGHTPVYPQPPQKE